MIRKNKNDIQRIGTYIDQKYSVTMSYRKSSAITDCEIWYYEIMVWSTVIDNRSLKPDKYIYSCNGEKEFNYAFKEYNRLVKIFTYLQRRSLRGGKNYEI